MKESGLLSLVALLGLQSCEDIFHQGPYIVFEQLDSGCGGEEQASLQGGEGKILFEGVVATPDPCYDLAAELVTMRCGPSERCVNTYEVAIASKDRGDYCVKCIGSVSYRGEIRGLAAGVYSISISHDGRRVAAEQVQVD